MNVQRKYAEPHAKDSHFAKTVKHALFFLSERHHLGCSLLCLTPTHIPCCQTWYSTEQPFRNRQLCWIHIVANIPNPKNRHFGSRKLRRHLWSLEQVLDIYVLYYLHCYYVFKAINISLRFVGSMHTFILHRITRTIYFSFRRDGIKGRCPFRPILYGRNR